jgi:hypothetical protein
MESSIGIELPKYNLHKKENYEPLLLECLNRSPFFKEKSGGGLASPKSESNSECDALGRNGYYNIDFKCLISEDGAKNMSETSLTKKRVVSRGDRNIPLKGIHAKGTKLTIP